MAQNLVLKLLQESGHRFLAVRKVGKTLRNSVFQLFKDVINNWNLSHLFKFKEVEMRIECINGSALICLGIDDPEKVKSITGITGIWIEEASELKPSDFRQLNLRLRGRTKYKQQIFLTFNPISEHNWIKKDFFDKPYADSYILKTTYLDNKFIGEEYREQLEELKEKDFLYYQVYCLGEWGVLGNLVFSNYKVEEISRNPDDYECVYSGIDFGWNDPTAYVRIGLKDNELYVFEEIYQSKTTTKDIIELVKQKQSTKEIIVCDSAEPDRIEEFKNAGFKKANAAKKGAGSIKGGIDKIKQHKVHIHPSCVNFIREIQGYKYKEDKDGNVYDEPVDFNNHLMDAMRYALEMKKAKKKVKAGFSLY